MGGITKNKIRERLKGIFRVRSWKLVMLLVPMVFLVATLLRFEHIGMVERRDAVLAADKKGEPQAIADALTELKRYTFSHIVVNVVEENGVEWLSFGTGPFYLEHQYSRRAMEELRRAEESLAGVGNNPNGNVFQKASAVCDALAKKYGWGYSKPYIDCVQGELEKYPAMDEIEDFKQAMIPPTALYRQEFASPIWYPTWAGVLTLLIILLIVVIITRVLIWGMLRIALVFVKK